MNYSKLISQLTAEMKKKVARWDKMKKGLKIFLIIVFVPFIASFILNKVIFWLTMFFYQLLGAPAGHLHHWLHAEKDTVQHATQAVLYAICMPVVFGLEVILSLASFLFYIEWFVLQIHAIIITLGGTKFQPFLNEATFDEE